MYYHKNTRMIRNTTEIAINCKIAYVQCHKELKVGLSAKYTLQKIDS